jgi:hypothetical protein
MDRSGEPLVGLASSTRWPRRLLLMACPQPSCSAAPLGGTADDQAVFAEIRWPVSAQLRRAERGLERGSGATSSPGPWGPHRPIDRCSATTEGSLKWGCAQAVWTADVSYDLIDGQIRAQTTALASTEPNVLGTHSGSDNLLEAGDDAHPRHTGSVPGAAGIYVRPTGPPRPSASRRARVSRRRRASETPCGGDSQPYWR